MWKHGLVGAVLVGSTWGQVTQRVSVSVSGVQGNQNTYRASVSFDGRYVAFASAASNLVADSNHVVDVFVRDRSTGVLELVSVSTTGEQGNGNSFEPSISADGRYVAFASFASNLVAGDTNGVPDVFVRDRVAQTTVRVSVDSRGLEGNGSSSDLHGSDGLIYDLSGPAISADGRHVAFASRATNLVPGDTNGKLDVFVRDLDEGITRCVSVDSGGLEGDGDSGNVGLSISEDGRYVAFASHATNLVLRDTNGKLDVFLHDRRDGMLMAMSADVAGYTWDGDSFLPSISADGRFVAFTTSATNIVPNGSTDVVVRDRLAGTTQVVSREPDGQYWDDADFPSISADGRYVAFAGFGLTWQDFGWYEIYVRDRQTSTTELISPGIFGLVNRDADCDFPAISGDGGVVAFESWSDQLVPFDTGGFRDAFVRVRAGGTGFTILCEPGTDGVVDCPCANPPGGNDRGCDNSAHTGGAGLTASGGSFLSSDSLVLRTSGEPVNAASVVLQGSTSAQRGTVYGQGVRCIGGAIRRLYTVIAEDGHLTIPAFRRSDPQVSRRSEEQGDLIRAGESRWYQVVYRDPIVLGGCPASSTFNCTQTGRIDWSP